jgi:proton-translocating NADH-quinone oxidoreductase chain L
MLLLILWLPFIGFLGGSFCGRHMGRGIVFFTTFHVFVTFCVGFFLLCTNFTQNKISTIVISPWIVCDALEVNWELYCDNLTLSMVCVVTSVSTLVHLYASEYMENDPHLQRFMCYLSLFTFFMLILVTAGNFIQMFVGWEGVGLASYLLINFWHTRIQANKAAIKAMLFNRVADMFMLLGLFSIYLLFETFDYPVIFAVAPLVKNVTITIGFYNGSVIDFICLFLFLGAMGKSAQFGFHNWLPDAMEGPTPVSALIHAATMVTAGIFLLIRCSFLFELSPFVLQLVAIVGSVTALFGAYTGLFSHDIKKVIAFSTCSQLGYMMLACGLERYNAAFFHLVSHAFFKALLFLAAGAIIHAAFDEQDVRKYGSFRRYLPLTYICFLIGSLNLMGIPFLSGFYTKDLILELAFTGITPVSIFCYALGVHSVIVTSAYSTRILILTFLTEPNNNRYYINSTHESSWNIKIALITLAFLSIFAGYFLADIFAGLGTSFFGNAFFFNINNYNVSDIEFIDPIYKLIPLLAVAKGMIFSFCLYIKNKQQFFEQKQSIFFKSIYSFLLKKWYTDRLVNEVLSASVLIFAKKYPYNSLDRGFLEIFGPTAISRGTTKVLYSSTDIIKFGANFFY